MDNFEKQFDFIKSKTLTDDKLRMMANIAMSQPQLNIATPRPKSRISKFMQMLVLTSGVACATALTIVVWPTTMEDKPAVVTPKFEAAVISPEESEEFMQLMIDDFLLSASL